MLLLDLVTLTSMSAASGLPTTPCQDGLKSVKFFIPPKPNCAADLAALSTGPFALPPDATAIELCVEESTPGGTTAHAQTYHYRLLEGAYHRDLKTVRKILVVGSGSGVEAVTLARGLDARVDATDIDEASVRVTQINAERFGVADRVRAWRSDLFESVSEAYDLILFNAPRPLRGPDYEESTRDFGDEVGVINGVRRPLRPTFEDWLRWFAAHAVGPYFDLRGVILERTLATFTPHLAPWGKFILMTTRHLPDLVGDSRWDVKLLSKAPWGPHEAEEFGIFELGLVGATRR